MQGLGLPKFDISQIFKDVVVLCHLVDLLNAVPGWRMEVAKMLRLQPVPVDTRILPSHLVNGVEIQDSDMIFTTNDSSLQECDMAYTISSTKVAFRFPAPADDCDLFIKPWPADESTLTLNERSANFYTIVSTRSQDGSGRLSQLEKSLVDGASGVNLMP